MSASFRLARLDAPALVKGVSVVALAIGAGVWGAVLLAPAAREVPPVLDVSEVALDNTAPVAQWFGGAALRVRVAAAGVIASGDGGGAALLSVDGGPLRAYRAGQVLAPGVVLDSVSAASVFIDQDGVVEEVTLPVNPLDAAQGFVPVSTAPTAGPR